MILRRITEHIKAQNWTAICIDFVIVVVGVFMGIQLGNWNEARVFAASEKSFLEELRTEIQFNNALMKARIDVMGRVLEAGRDGREFLTAGAPCTDDCWKLTVDIFHASQVMNGPSSRTVFDQMKRLDLPKSQTIKDLMAQYYGLESAMAESFDTRPAFRHYVRKALPSELQRTLWEHCYELKGVAEYLIKDCPQDADDAVTREALEILRANPDVAAELNYWLGMHELWVPILQEIIVRGEETITAINTELEENK